LRAVQSKELQFKVVRWRGFGNGLEVPYALIMSDEDQDSLGTTSENIVTLNRVIFSDGITVEDGSKIRFAYPGQYLVTRAVSVC
jgi:hypothetical protein